MFLNAKEIKNSHMSPRHFDQYKDILLNYRSEENTKTPVDTEALRAIMEIKELTADLRYGRCLMLVLTDRNYELDNLLAEINVGIEVLTQCANKVKLAKGE